MNAYFVAGGALAVWAVLVALIGMRGFPSGRGLERVAILITVILFAGAVTSAIADQNKVGERRGPEIDKPGEGPETSKPGQPTGGESAPSAAGASESAPKDEGEQKDKPAPTALTLTADPTGQLKFDKTALQTTAGHVTITMTNPAPIGHNIALRGNGVDERGKVVQGNAKSTIEADLQPGVSYEFYCSVPGHEQGGMHGTLAVK